jgi:hypothetical protein
MSPLLESLKRGPLMTMTLECETEFPKALKNIMISMGMEGEAVYKGFPYMDDGRERWWVQLHLFKSPDDDHKRIGLWMFTNHDTVDLTFLDAARRVAWKAIVELGERLRWRLHNTQQDLKEAEEEIESLKSEAEKNPLSLSELNF